MSNHKGFGSRDGDFAERAATTHRPATRNEVDHELLAAGLARRGVFTAGSLLALQRTIGNQGVQQALAVQRKAEPEGVEQEGDELVLKEGDFSPELETELSGKFHMLQGPESGSGTGSTLASSYEDRRAEKARLEADMKAQGRYWSRSRGKYRHKRTAKWIAERTGAHARGFVRGTHHAYKKGGIHSILSQRMAKLNKAEKLINQGNYRAAASLVPSTSTMKNASLSKRLKVAAAAPIIFARMAHENAKASELRDRLRRHWNEQQKLWEEQQNKAGH